jgi:predicted regulator of Ras-like GTPase activity (Roadblock/LC7/MglB family)
MTVFDHILQEALEAIPGATAIAFIDREGESVGTFCLGESIDTRLLAAHWGISYQLTQSLFSKLHWGTPQEVILLLYSIRIIIRHVEDGYLLICSLTAESPIAFAIMKLKGVEEKLREAMG